MADGSICDACDDGRFKLQECPRDYIGEEMTFAINLATNCGKGDWPVSGGLLDQSAWFMQLRQSLIADQNRIDAERSE